MKVLAGVVFLLAFSSGAFAGRLSNDQVNHLKDKIMEWQTTNSSLPEFCANIHLATKAANVILYNATADLRDLSHYQSKIQSREFLELKERQVDFQRKAQELDQIEKSDCR
jgi:hypothetical protein